MSIDHNLSHAITHEACARLQHGFKRITHCAEQLDEEQIWWRGSDELNSIGNLILHLCGNLRQWVIHGLVKGEDDRDRPAEFSTNGGIQKAELLSKLRSTITEAEEAIRSVGEQLLEPRKIQGFDVTVLGAIMDSVPHFSGHTQEIIYITRSIRGRDYEFEWEPSTPEEGAPVP